VQSSGCSRAAWRVRSSQVTDIAVHIDSNRDARLERSEYNANREDVGDAKFETDTEVQSLTDTCLAGNCLIAFHFPLPTRIASLVFPRLPLLPEDFVDV